MTTLSAHDFLVSIEVDAKRLYKKGVSTLIAEDSKRVDRFFCEGGSLTLDITKQVIDQGLLERFTLQAQLSQLPKHIETLFNGGVVNTTEQRPALHWLLRTQQLPSSTKLESEFSLVQSTRQRMEIFCQSVIDGEYQSAAGKAFDTVVNLGVGGSDLGPRLAIHALDRYANHLDIHFVANIDGNDILNCLAELDPATTLFVATSKTFGTLETIENAKVAWDWLEANTIDQPARHFVAATSRPDRAEAFGIAPDVIFPMWDWIGGRYSMLSSVGLSIMLGIGVKNFNALRAGAEGMDKHFQEAPLAQNLPFLQAVVGIISVNGLGWQNHAIIGYDSQLELFPAYLQQLEMESNGKSIDLESQPIEYQTCPIVWGGTGTNTQHSFHQLLHQGRVRSNIDFLMPIRQEHNLKSHQSYLQANCIAQAQALLHGKSIAEVRQELEVEGVSTASITKLAPHKQIKGNKPCSIIGFDRLTPQTLGALIALYEHKVFVQAHFWNINPFDQWGVELGKQLCLPVAEEINRHDLNHQYPEPTANRWIQIIGKRNSDQTQQ